MDFWLRYERKGEQYHATFGFAPGDNLEDITTDWNTMLRKLAKYMSTFPQAQLILHRIDHPYAVPVRIPQAEIDLFRLDPVQAIRNWTYGLVDETNPMAPIPVAYEVLPDLFGDEIYVRLINGRIESPFTGFNVPVEVEDDGWIRDTALGIPMHVVTPQWVTCLTSDLLAAGGDTFFIPRAWNPSSPWIRHEELESRYNKYLEEKSKA